MLVSFGIALSGGGAKGAAHVGVLLALEEYGMSPNSISGTSAGSIVAGLYATGTGPKDLKEITQQLSKTGVSLIDPDYTGIIKSAAQFLWHNPVTLTGFIKGNKLEKYICTLTNNKNISQTNIRTVLPCVDLNSGHTIAYTNTLDSVRQLNGVEWKTDIPICIAMMASSAVPAVFKPKIIDGMCLVDGGITDNLPIDLLAAAGERNILAVEICENYNAPESNNIIEIASHSLSLMGRHLRKYISSGEKLLLRPVIPDQAGLFTFSYMIECIQIGYDTTIKAMPVIKSLFC